MKPDFRRSNLAALLLCTAGIAVNMILSAVVTALKLPIYLDTVGTVMVSILGGALPGVIVGCVTNVIKAVMNPASLYYGVINVTIAVCAAFFAGRGWHKKIRGIIGMVLIFTLISGGLGALIPWFMEGISFESGSLTGIIYGTGLFSREIAHLLSNLLIDLPDKAITVLIALTLLHFVPERYYGVFTFNMWMQDPGAHDEYHVKEHSAVRVASLRIKTLLVLVIALTSVALVCSVLSVQVFRRMTVNEHSKLAQGTANLAAGAINGDYVDSYIEYGESMQAYKDTKERLRQILYSSSEISYLYVYKVEQDGFRVVFDLDTAETPAEAIGSLRPFDPGFVPYIPQLLAGESVDPIISNGQDGYLLTALKPVINTNGKCVCYAIADVDMEKLDAYGRSFLTEMISIFLGFFILLCTFTIWLTDYHIIYPINSIARGMDKLAKTSDTQEDMDEDVKMFRKYGIHTGDEIENLYLSAKSMTRNQAEQMRSIRRLSESTAKMQDGLILTMADLVESRDSDTGAHVQKTAAYVKIIVEGLKRKGYYSEKITPKFMSDIVRSAPLHDVGKINIPDEVLNKPGKLDPEEFEIMKTHTTAGKQIMDNAINKVKGDNYLKEARNMAAYHHERWDGKGYPEGIHGEVIPLSARIMAVADVFDALTSPRVYKPAFSLEKSLAILEEGKGTQFDPKCVEVFMEALPEVKVVLRKYNREM
ncbi:MAG: HD domain-containing protein [Lachnospiraceae bacterium]|nr:HD domain-containing protein [Lachnospiraceae bacterium]